MKNAYKQLFRTKIDKHPSTSSIKHQDLFCCIVLSEIIKNIAVEGLNASSMSHTDMFSIILISAKSNDITNIFVASIIVQKIAYTSIHDIIMPPVHFETKNKDLRPLWRLKIDSYQP